MDKDQIADYNRKIDAVFNMELDADLAYCVNVLDKWVESKPESKSISKFKDAFINIYSKLHSLRMEKELAHKGMAQYKSDKLRAIERARKAEKELEELKKDKQINI